MNILGIIIYLGYAYFDCIRKKYQAVYGDIFDCIYCVRRLHVGWNSQPIVNRWRNIDRKNNFIKY